METVEDEVESAFGRLATPANGIPHLQSRSLQEDPELIRAQALAAPDEWFVKVQGRAVGPLTVGQVRKWWEEQMITPQTQCWGAGLVGWTPLCQVMSLQRALSPLAPAPAIVSHFTRPQPRAPQPAAGEAPRPCGPLLPEVGPPPPQAPAPQAVRPYLPAPAEAPRLPARDLPRRALPAAEEVDEAPRGSLSRAVRTAMAAGVFALVLIAGMAFLALPWLLDAPRPGSLPDPVPALPEPAAEAVKTPEPAAPAPAPVQVPAQTVKAVKAPEPAAPAKPAPRPRHARASPAAAEPEAPVIDPNDPAEVPAPPRTVADDTFDRVFGRPPGEPQAASAQPVLAKTRVKARLERADVMQVALAHKEQVVRCRAAALAQDPDLSGQLVLRWTVDVEGQVDGVVEVLPGKLAGTALGDCVAEAVQGWKFPRHAEAQGPITFPFQF
jgi:hypothetical protein